jgi:hypothetical protein
MPISSIRSSRGFGLLRISASFEENSGDDIVVNVE